MRPTIVALSTLAVAFAQDFKSCGETPCFSPDLSHVNTKIVGGDPARPYSWPWQVSLCIISGPWKDQICDHICGGSVIDRLWVMTAAHCIDRGEDKYAIKAGVFDVTRSDEHWEQMIRVARVIVHPEYNSTTKKNDIALIELRHNFELSPTIQKVCLPTNDTVARRGNKLWVTGWGVTHEGSTNAPHELRQANVPVVNITTCESMYPGKLFPKRQFCAGMEGVDSCQGDSGGPAVAKSPTGRWFQYGVVSWGKGCARKDKPGVYTRVSAFCSWITKITKSEVVCR